MFNRAAAAVAFKGFADRVVTPPCSLTLPIFACDTDKSRPDVALCALERIDRPVRRRPSPI